MIKDNNQYIIEFRKVGNCVKVSAICSTTYNEVSMIVPSNLSRFYMKKLAINKLDFIKNKNRKNFNKIANEGNDIKA